MLNRKALLSVPLYMVTGLLAASPVLAQDVVIYGGLAFDHTTKSDAYASFSEISGYAELEWKGIYVGAGVGQNNWDGNDWADVYVGYRGETGQLSYDAYLDYVFYTEKAGDEDYVEFGLGLDYALTDSFSMGVDYASTAEFSYEEVYVSAAYTISDAWSVDAAFGQYGWPSDYYAAWEVGATYYFADEYSLDLRYYDEEASDAYFGLTLAWDTTIFGG